ncbi:MAG: (Fe-S)-binding protein [Candidatus Aminicenantes bacterium]
MNLQSCFNQKTRKRIGDEFIRHLSGGDAVFLQTCARCGLCADSCHYYIAEADPRNIPAYKLNLLFRAFKRLMRKSGVHCLEQETVNEWVEILFGRCTLCGRCAVNCTMGINIPRLIRTARGALAAVGLVPDGLQSTVTTALEKGNNMGITKEDWLETVEWLEEELQDELNDPRASIPVDKKDCRLLYTINPREAMFFPLSISSAAKVFYAAGESWTFPSENFDVTNYGLYSGNDRDAGEMSGRLTESLQKLNCRELILAECGHGFNSNRWEAPEWLQKHCSFPVKSIIEVIADYIRQDRIRLDPEKNSKTVTLHDPCNLVRLGGIIEIQRLILSRSVKNFVEMIPNREKNFCCGGGGGQLAMTRFAKRRLQAGRIKAEQIRKTGAEIVVTPCHNCIDQLMELNKHYKLNIEVKTITEMVADALI